MIAARGIAAILSLAFLDQPNDTAVSVRSVARFWKQDIPTATVKAIRCNDLSYSSDAESLRGFRDALLLDSLACRVPSHQQFCGDVMIAGLCGMPNSASRSAAFIRHPAAVSSHRHAWRATASGTVHGHLYVLENWGLSLNQHSLLGCPSHIPVTGTVGALWLRLRVKHGTNVIPQRHR